MNIGFFDSGLGGLIVLKAVAAAMPEYDFSFYGDTANLPYGDKTEEEIYEMTKEGMAHLFEGGSVLVIIACNTASAETLRRLQDEFLPAEYPDGRILGVIIPTIEEAVVLSKSDVLLLATKRTVVSGKYDIEFNKKGGQGINLTSVATPELVPFIELGEIDAAVRAAVKKIDLAAGESEVVILGCTHYTQLKDKLREHYGDKKIFLSQDEIIPDKLKSYLDNHSEIESRISSTGKRGVHLSKHRPDYDQLMSQFLGGVFMPAE